MRVISNCKIQIGNSVILPGKVMEISDEVRRDRYFAMCVQSGYVQIVESVKEEKAGEDDKAKDDRTKADEGVKIYKPVKRLKE